MLAYLPENSFIDALSTHPETLGFSENQALKAEGRSRAFT
jgi:hypothetical protein